MGNLYLCIIFCIFVACREVQIALASILWGYEYRKAIELTKFGKGLNEQIAMILKIFHKIGAIF